MCLTGAINHVIKHTCANTMKTHIWVAHNNPIWPPTATCSSVPTFAQHAHTKPTYARNVVHDFE